MRPRTLEKTIGEFYLRWLTRDRIAIILYRIYHDVKYRRLSKYEEAKEFVESNHLYRQGILTDPDFFMRVDNDAPIEYDVFNPIEYEDEEFDDELEDFYS